MSRRPSAQLKRRLADHRKWLASNDFMLAHFRSLFDQTIVDETISGLYASSSALEFSGLYYAIRGMLSVIDGSDAGWGDIVLAIEHRRLATDIGVRIIEMDALREKYSSINRTRHRDRAANLLCYALARGEDALAMHWYSVLQRARQWTETATEPFWHIREFSTLAVALYDDLHRIGQPLEVSAPDERALRSEDPLAVVQVLNDLADDHCLQIEDDGEGRYPAFEEPPFDLVPFELLALQAVRARRGLETPRVDHPLLKLATAQLPANIPPPLPDEMLSRSREVFLRVFGAVSSSPGASVSGLRQRLPRPPFNVSEP